MKATALNMIPTRKIWLAVIFALALVAGHDAAVPVRKAYGARAAIAAIDQYRTWISPRLKGHVFCRFTPTCSLYGRESIRKYGLLVGGARAAWRVARCNPWTPAGTFDPP